jgi:hypothetical protein
MSTFKNFCDLLVRPRRERWRRPKRLWRGGGPSRAHSRTLSHRTRMHCICMHCTRALVRCSTTATEEEAERFRASERAKDCEGRSCCPCVCWWTRERAPAHSCLRAHTLDFVSRRSTPMQRRRFVCLLLALACVQTRGILGSGSFGAFGHGAFALSSQRATHAAASTKP